METFLNINGAELNIDDDALEELFLSIAEGKLSRDEVDEFLREKVL
jgi:prophage maintenance system killer protein